MNANKPSNNVNANGNILGKVVAQVLTIDSYQRQSTKTIAQYKPDANNSIQRDDYKEEVPADQGPIYASFKAPKVQMPSKQWQFSLMLSLSFAT